MVPGPPKRAKRCYPKEFRCCLFVSSVRWTGRAGFSIEHGAKDLKPYKLTTEPLRLSLGTCYKSSNVLPEPCSDSPTELRQLSFDRVPTESPVGQFPSSSYVLVSSDSASAAERTEAARGGCSSSVAALADSKCDSDIGLGFKGEQDDLLHGLLAAAYLAMEEPGRSATRRPPAASTNRTGGCGRRGVSAWGRRRSAPTRAPTPATTVRLVRFSRPSPAVDEGPLPAAAEPRAGAAAAAEAAKRIRFER